MSLTAGLALPTWALFYFIGTCLWAFYRAFPTPAVQALQPDAVFPDFIMHQLPPGPLQLPPRTNVCPSQCDALACTALQTDSACLQIAHVVCYICSTSNMTHGVNSAWSLDPGFKFWVS